MLNQLLRFTLVSSALLWLRPRWRGLLALSAAVILIHILHGEYLGYVELSGNSEFLVGSYVCKWLALIICVLLYVGLAIYGLKPPQRKLATSKSSKVSKGSNAAPSEQDESVSQQPEQSPVVADDGFDFLRDKTKLENRADKVIAKNRH